MSDNTSLAAICPSAVEFRGYYNRRLEELFDDDEPLEARLANAPPLLNVVEPLPPWTIEEFWTTRTELEAYLARVVPARPAPPLPDQAGPLPFVRSDTDDRTLVVDIPAFELIDVPLLRRIQREFVQQHPLWRLILLGEDEETAVVVYPQAIRIGGAPLGADLGAELRKLTVAVRQAIIARESPNWRQLARAQERLSTAIRELQRARIALVTVLQGGFQQDPAWLTIYVLVHQRDTLKLAATAAAEIQSSGSYDVDAVGNITFQFGESKEYPFALAVYYVPGDYRGMFEAFLCESDARLLIDLATVEIWRDPELDRTLQSHQ